MSPGLFQDAIGNAGHGEGAFKFRPQRRGGSRTAPTVHLLRVFPPDVVAARFVQCFVAVAFLDEQFGRSVLDVALHLAEVVVDGLGELRPVLGTLPTRPQLAHAFVAVLGVVVVVGQVVGGEVGAANDHFRP